MGREQEAASVGAPKPVSLFLSTYEQPFHLRLVFEALLRQSFRDFEILVCDDGSGAETKRIIDDYRRRSTDIPIRHFWQENLGFRKCRILNEALRSATGDYCVFLDGDCVPHRDYVGDHFAKRKAGRYLAGRRAEISEKIGARLTPEKVRAGYFDFPRLDLLLSGLDGESEAINRTVRIPNAFLRRLLKLERVTDMKGCNYSVHKESLVAINGFDEDYEGYGREDTDVELRLQNLGLSIKSMRGLALQFHIWHPRREFVPANDTRLAEVVEKRVIRCRNGLTKE